MAALDHIPAPSVSIFARFSAALSRAFSAHVDASARKAEFEFYDRMSDAELAERGLARHQIAAHVFRDKFLMV